MRSAENIIAVALTGCGRIGSRLAAALLARLDRYWELYGVELRLVGVCGSTAGIVRPEGLRPADLARENWTPGLSGIRLLEETAADVLIEAGPNDYGTGGPGVDHLRWAVDRGVDVVSISKSALALHGASLLEAASRSGSRVTASCASASALPVVDFLRYDLAGVEPSRVEAVLTGTASFVLDAMMRPDRSIEEAVAEAVERGIAEPDPSFDLDGWDTAAKLVVIAGLAFGEWLELDAVPRVSVRGVTQGEVLAWREAGETPALVGVLERDGSGYRAEVVLRAFPADHPYASARGSTKALFVEAEPLGAYSLIGGASSQEATVAAALKDLEHLLAGR